MDEPVTSGGRRLALLVAVSDYTDPSLQGLRAPAADAAALGEVLADPEVGSFDVTSVVDQDANRMRLELDGFLADRLPDDLLLVYLSCHGLVDLRRRLYFAARDTVKARLAASAVEASWLLDRLEECRARRQVVVLDCCFSGAFAQGAKGDPDLALGERLLGQGRGRVVLTASRGTEYSFEGEPVVADEPRRSVFTGALVAGIRTGAADTDRDGIISVDDAYAYAFEQVRQSGAQQTPQRWLYGAEGGIVLARTPPTTGAVRPTPAPAVPAGGPGTLGPAAPRGRRRPSRAVTGVAAVVAAVGALAALLVARPWSGGGSGADPVSGADRKPGDGLVSGPTSGVVDMTGPWRIEVRDDRSGNDTGCDITVEDRASGRRYVWRTLYGMQSFQVPGRGRFRWDTNHRDCLVATHAGPGDARLPLRHPAEAGDTDAFVTRGPVSVRVTDFSGSEACKLRLTSAATGRSVDLADVTPAGNPVVLETGGEDPVYLTDTDCSLEVSNA